MTRARREAAVLVAVVASVALHVALMALVAPQAMTRPLAAARPARRSPPVRVTRPAPRPETVRMDEVKDLAAVRDAPAARGADRSAAVVAPAADPAPAPPPAPQTPELRVSAPDPRTVFEGRLVGLDAAPRASEPAPFAEIPPLRPRVPDAPGGTPGATAVRVAPPAVASPVIAPPPSPSRLAWTGRRTPRPAFAPSATVYARVDERVVAAEKAAVGALVGADDAADLEPLVTVSLAESCAGDWRYFRVTATPRRELSVVPKDVVILIDGSGSIGNDRLTGCRAAARRILRSCTNTGDRFNLVVFRDAFSYAFQSWRPCDAASFSAADEWLGRETAHGRTDVFASIRSVLTLPRDPARPLVALVVTDGEANEGVRETAAILSRFTELNDGLVSVYMYGVKEWANRELIDLLTHGNRGEGFVFEGARGRAGEGMEALSERFRDPVLTDLRLVLASGTAAETYPGRLRNLCRGGTAVFWGRIPKAAREVAFSLRGLHGGEAYEGFFRIPFAGSAEDAAVVAEWSREREIARALEAASGKSPLTLR